MTLELDKKNLAAKEKQAARLAVEIAALRDKIARRQKREARKG